MGSKMTNTNLLKDLEKALESGDIKAISVLNVLEKFTQVKQPDHGNKMMQILYFIGGGIVFMGIAFWIGQEWKHLGTVGKILCTLGIAIGFFVSAVLLGQQKEHGTLSNVFFMISGFLMPIGLGVTYDELDFKVNSYSIGTQIFALLSFAYGGAYFLYRKNLLLLLSILFASGLFFITTDWLLSETYFTLNKKFHLYRIFFVGLSWLLLGHAFSSTERQPLTSFLYVFGLIAVLTSGLILSDWKPNQSVFWEIVYPGLALGIVFLSTLVRSRAFLIFGSLGFGAYLCKITAEYFSDSLGWPLALILMGFLLIGIAFAALRIRNKYLSNNAAA
jgi:hypothetical protein